ncbi:MAG: hypothetical protein E7453_06195 [Ruminococcaceae bacterium]|nr:hypothetical protein [Oscillospiraceae bacterium]
MDIEIDINIAEGVGSEEYFLQKAREAYDYLKGSPKAKLIRIYKSFKWWDWPIEYGPCPVENWEELPLYRRPDMPEDAVTKATYLDPIAAAIRLLDVMPSDTD